MGRFDYSTRSKDRFDFGILLYIRRSFGFLYVGDRKFKGSVFKIGCWRIFDTDGRFVGFGSSIFCINSSNEPSSIYS